MARSLPERSFANLLFSDQIKILFGGFFYAIYYQHISAFLHFYISTSLHLHIPTSATPTSAISKSQTSIFTTFLRPLFESPSGRLRKKDVFSEGLSNKARRTSEEILCYLQCIAHLQIGFAQKISNIYDQKR